MNKIWVYALLFVVGLIGAVGDIAINQWAKSHRIVWWLTSCAIWISAASLFGVLLRWQYFTLGIAVVVALLVHCGVVLAWDAMWEGVRLSPLQWLGVLCAALAFCLIEIGKRTPNTDQTQISNAPDR